MFTFSGKETKRIIEDAIDQWRRRLHACIRVTWGHSEYSLEHKYPFKLILNLLLNKTILSDCHYFSDIYVYQGNVGMHLRCGGIFSDRFVTRLLPSALVKEFWKSVNTWQSYGKE